VTDLVAAFSLAVSPTIPSPPTHEALVGFLSAQPECSALGVKMMGQDFEIEYDGNGKAQINHVPQPQSQQAMPHNIYGGQHYAPPYGYPPYKEPFRLPAIINTGLTIIFAAGLFFGAERYAPRDLKPSTMVGGFEAEVGAQMKAAELNKQARFAAYEAETKLAVETQAKQNEMMLQAILQNYQAVYDRAKIMAEAANNYQGKYLDARIAQTTAVQSADTGIVGISKLIGRGLNLIEPGSGEAALEYAENLNDGLVAGLTEAAQDAVRVDLTDWNFGLPPPAEVQAMVASVRPVQIPKPPKLSRHGYGDDTTNEDRAPQNGGR
jgi:hypothetical protein